MSMSRWGSGLTQPVSMERDHVRGPDRAVVTLVQYADFECPHSAAASAIVESIRQRAGSQLRIVYRHYPLANLHPHADAAAEAAEIAGTHGMFWDMHDVLFENQEHLEPPYLLAYAGALGLETAVFRRELLERVHASRVRDHFMSGVRSGVSGTPTFFVNGVRHEGSYDLASLMSAIETAERLAIVRRTPPPPPPAARRTSPTDG